MAAAKQVVQTAQEAFEVYRVARASNALIQSAWHTEVDGRQLACGLGVLGKDVKGASDCPAAVMPRWLAQVVPGFFDRQNMADAFEWGERFYAQLARIGGVVPFSVLHDWHATCVCPLGIEAAEKRGKPTEPHKALQALHQRALVGDLTPRDEWFAVLRNDYAYADAYTYAYAYAYADADAYAYAYAYANAKVYAKVYANAYADASAYAWKRLADGMVDALSRVTPTVTQAEAV